MKIKNLFIIIFFLLIINITAYELNIIKNTTSEILLEFSLNNYEIREFKKNEKIYSKIVLRNSNYNFRNKEPLVPFITENIIIPEVSNYSTQLSSLAIECKKIKPLPAAIKPFRLGDKVSIKDNKITDKYLPESIVEFSNTYILRDFKGLTIRINPFQFNSHTNQLKIIQKFNLRIDFSRPSNINFPSLISKPFFEIYKNRFINFRNYLKRYPPIIDSGNMIIISDSEFADSMQELSIWKNRKGIPTQIYEYPEATGSGETALKNFIQSQYDENDITFILLVGDDEQIPAATGYSGWANGNEADPVYALLEGDDEYPDALIGRFSVEDETQIQTVVNKNLSYEMEAEIESDWFNKATGIASNEAFPPFPVDWYLMAGLRDTLLAYNYTHVDQFYDPGVTPLSIADAVDEGRSWINYLGHGGITGWNTGYFNVNQVEQLNNDFKLPVVISVACNVGNFAEQTCFAETWQRHGSPEIARGSIAFLGASVGQNVAAWVGQEEIINRLVQDDFSTVGGVAFNGMMQAIDVYPGIGVGTGSECVQSWHLFGDPSLSYYTDTPTEMVVQHSDLTPDIENLEVEVFAEQQPVLNALAALNYNGILIGSNYTDANGFAQINLDSYYPDGSTIELIVTAFNKLPYFEEISSTTAMNELVENNDKASLSIYPNPFNANTRISFSILQREHVIISIFNSKGQKIKILSDRIYQPGEHYVVWDGTDINNKQVSSGFYFYKFTSKNYNSIKKCLLLK